MKCPYTYPARSRANMTAYLADHESRHGERRFYPLAWNVKVGRFDSSGRGDEATNPAYDAEWAAHVQQDDELFNMAAEGASRQLTDGEYTTYPGDDQGQWKFTFIGRSGGWLVLTEWVGYFNFDSRYSEIENAAGWRAALDDLPFKALRALYRAVRCMDQDFRRENVNAEMAYQYHFFRTIWEEQHSYTLEAQAAADNEAARALEASRPDMYGQGVAP